MEVSSSFSELGLSASLVDVLGKLSITVPTEIQRKAIPSIIAGRDIAASAETGSGKTAAFLLPIIERLTRPVAQPVTQAPAEHAHTRSRRGPRVPRAMILAPTRELVLQIETHAKSYCRASGLRSVSLVGGASMNRQIKALKDGADIIIATPGRLNDLISRRFVPLKAIEILVLDEADRMLDMGFLPQVRQIVVSLPENRQTLLLSATFSTTIEKLARELLSNPVRLAAAQKRTTVATLTQKAFPVLSHHKEPLLLALLKQNEGSFLVFTRTKRMADRVARILTANDHTVATLHSDRNQSQRNAALNSFRDGRVRVLVATDVAARGIDVDHISHVINYEVPGTAEDYVHRVGRTARAGRAGSALTLVSPSEESALGLIERATGVRLERSRLKGFSDGRSEQQMKTSIDMVQARSSFTRSFSPRRASR